jgi:ABC-type bacteriocin transporter
MKVKQRDNTDCGAACLASVAAYYNLKLPVSKIRQFAGTDKLGTNIMGMIEAAEKLGFQAKGAKGSRKSLDRIPLPAIAHIISENALQHYIVIYRVKKNRMLIMDPADGKMHRKSVDLFEKQWTGIVVLLIPGNDFSPVSETTSNLKRFINLIRPHTDVMIQALAGAIVYTILGLSFSIYLQKIIDHVLQDGNIRLLNLLSVLMIVILLFQMVIGNFKSIFALKTGQLIDARLILGYYQHLLRLPQRFFDTMRVGEIISRVNDAVKIRAFVNEVALNIIVNVFIVFFSIGLMFFYNWKLALIIMGIVPVYMVLYFINNRVNKKWQRILMERSAGLETQLVESLNAAGTIKRFGLEQHFNFKIENSFILLLKAIFKSGKLGLLIGSSIDFLNKLFTVFLLWAGSYYVIRRELSPGELFSFYALIAYFTGPAASLLGANRDIQDALIASDRLFEIIDLETDTSYNNKVELIPSMIGDIEFHEVHFRYGSRPPVFQDLSLKIMKGRTTAIVGESGSGKSTMLSLVQNLYPLKAGKITIGGLDLNYISRNSLRKMISVVPQNIDLFAGSVIENISIGDPEPDMHRILEISNVLGLHDFIEKLPERYNTVLNEQGLNLSGGQRQRIAIARALYKNPEILILDEATSSLDPESEQKLQQALVWFRQQNKTIIIIAHRLSTIRKCEMIMVLQNGKLSEQGTHQELLSNNKSYTNLWQFHTIG